MSHIPPFSFEFFPPRTEEGSQNLLQTVDKLNTFDPEFYSVTFGAGGSTDILGRAIAKELEDQYGWEVVAENKPGGGGIAMFTKIAVAKPDGLKIGMGVSMPTLINLVMRGDKLTFDLDSFDYLATVTRAQLAMIARTDSPFDDIAGLIEHSKSKGGALVGSVSYTHLTLPTILLV